MVCSWKKKKSFLFPAEINQERFDSDIHSRLSQTPQLSTLQLHQLFCNAIPLHNEPVALTPQEDGAESYNFSIFP